MSWAKSVIDKLNTIWIPHKHFRLAENDLLTALLTARPGEVVCLVGPSRVGKTSLVARLEPLVTGTPSVHDENHMPVVTLSAGNSSTNGFLSTKTFTASALTAIRHPIYGDTADSPWDDQRLRVVERMPEGMLRGALQKALRFRRTHFLVIDEAHHFMHIRGGIAAAATFLDSLKCLAGDTGVRLVLVGTYQLLPLLQRSPHMLGRKIQVHFPRYRGDVRDDIIAFHEILAGYSRELRFSGSASLRDWSEFLYTGSYGCLGLLHAWIRDALRMAWIESNPSLKLKHFEMQGRMKEDSRSIGAEIADGERYIYGDELAPTQKLEEVAKRRGASTPKPFRRKPRRDVVGGEIRP